MIQTLSVKAITGAFRRNTDGEAETEDFAEMDSET